MVRGVVDAWSLDPIGSLKLGQGEHPVPPLTFARFQRLLALDAPAFARAIAGGDVRAAWPCAQVCVPAITRQEWDDYATQKTVADLFLLFVRAHDWEFIGEAIRFGQPQGPGETMPSQNDVAAGLLAVAKQSAHRIEDLLTMRVEGFYYVVEAIREEADRKVTAVREALGEVGGAPPGMAYETKVPSSLLDLMSRAEGVSDGNG